MANVVEVPPAGGGAHMTGSALDIVCFPDMDWDHVLWTNRQHVMYRLPRIDPFVRVLYVAPPRFALARRIGRAQRLARRSFPEDERRDGLFVRRIGDRLWVLQPLLPVPNRLARRLAPQALDRLTVALTRRTMRRLGFGQPVLWLYTPLAARYAPSFDTRLVCYDMVDDYPSFAPYQSAELVKADAELAREADLVFVASERVYEERGAENANMHLVGNAGDVELFAAAARGRTPAPPDLEPLRRPLIGFHGSIGAYKVDLSLVRELARRRPGWTFIFIGPLEGSDPLTILGEFSNIHFLGFRDQQALPAYVAQFDVAVIPYRRTRYTERLNALKLYEYLAAGRPVVATDLPCFRPFEHLISIASGADAFEAALADALEDEPKNAARARVEAVAPYTWEAKAERMLDLVRRSLQ